MLNILAESFLYRPAHYTVSLQFQGLWLDSPWLLYRLLLLMFHGDNLISLTGYFFPTLWLSAHIMGPFSWLL